MTTYTLSRQDIFDYQRCPKIVSIKAYRGLHPVKRKPDRAEPEVPAHVVGKIGETAVASIFSPAVAAAGISEVVQTVTHQAESKLVDMGVVLDGEVRNIFDETITGLATVRESVTREYGEIQVIGRGSCKNGPMPGEAMPDFVAIAPRHSQPILIEVKNTIRPVTTDHFQASFYNTVARNNGVVVQEQRIDSGHLSLNPIAYHESITDTLLIYPRLGEYQKISDRLDLRQGTIDEIWRAKQLGLMGQAPHTDCHSKCPHHRLRIELPEGNLEPAVPLGLIYAIGATEAGMDLDMHYLHSYFFRSGLASNTFDWTFQIKYHADHKTKEGAIDLVMTKTGLPRDVIERMAFSTVKRPDSNLVFRNMSGEFSPWKKILGVDSFASVSFKSKVQGISTRLYALPDKSQDFVKQSWKKWQR